MAVNPAQLPAPIAFMGVDFTPLDMAGAVAFVMDAANDQHFCYVVTPNVDHIVMLHKEGDEAWRPQYRRAVENAALRINDSRILSRLARLSGIALPAVPGSDLTREVLQRLAARDVDVALVGGSEGEVAWLRRALPEARLHHIQPPMGVRDDPAIQCEIVARIEAARPALTLLAIGAPQSELVARRIAEAGQAGGVGLCIGASVEFLSGTRRRAPRWMQAASLEWLFRLLSEPRRLWRRYLQEGPRIFLIWTRWERNRRFTSPPP